MALCDFYALQEDLRRLIEFLFSETDIVAYEMASQVDERPRQFRSLADLDSVYSLGAYRAGYLQLYSASVSAPPIITRIDLRSPIPKHRYDVNGAGLMQLYLDGRKDGLIHHSHFGHWNEAGARQRCVYPADDCDWHALRALSRKIQGFIRRELTSALLYSRPVLSQALLDVQNGNGLLFNADVHRSDSPALRRIR